MEDYENIVYPPNKAMQKLHFLNISPTELKHLTFIDINSKGEFIVGNTDVLGSWWNGSVFFYKNFDDARDHEIGNSYFEDAGISDGKFIDDSFGLISTDIGRLSLVNFGDNFGERIAICASDYYYCPQRVTQLDVWKNYKKAVICSDNFINLFNLDDGIRIVHDYKYYHTDLISSVSCNSSNEYVFVSGSWDHRACLWDTRMDMPATVINDMSMGPITSVAFYSEENVLMGGINGSVYSLDVRNPNEYINKAEAFNSQIIRIKPDIKTKLVAVCADSKLVRIFDCNKNEIHMVFEASSHSGFVRDFVWYDEKLYSCGVDSKICRHICF